MGRSVPIDTRNDAFQSERTAASLAERKGKAQAAAVQSLLDRHSADRPTMTELARRLTCEGVKVIPSFQASGWLNGFSYEYQGVRVRGSDLGRAYTAQGLQERKGVRYDPERDGRLLREYAVGPPLRPEPQGRFEPSGRERQPISARVRFYRLNPTERSVLTDVGRFRAIAAADLLRERYGDRSGPYRQDMDHLKAQRLVRSHRVMGSRGGPAWTVVTLTQEGKRLLENTRENKAQKIYTGLKKPREIAHDAAIYRMYQAAAQQMEREGGRVTRVVLDYELKRQVYPQLAKAQNLPAPAYQALQEEVARANGLKVVEGKIPLPDLRIEYETAEGERTKVDLELATEHYHVGQLQEKARAGFTIYAPGHSAGRLSAVLDRHDLVGEILAL